MCFCKGSIAEVNRWKREWVWKNNLLCWGGYFGKINFWDIFFFGKISFWVKSATFLCWGERGWFWKSKIFGEKVLLFVLRWKRGWFWENKFYVKAAIISGVINVSPTVKVNGNWQGFQCQRSFLTGCQGHRHAQGQKQDDIMTRLQCQWNIFNALSMSVIPCSHCTCQARQCQLYIQIASSRWSIYKLASKATWRVFSMYAVGQGFESLSLPFPPNCGSCQCKRQIQAKVSCVWTSEGEGYLKRSSPQDFQNAS